MGRGAPRVPTTILITPTPTPTPSFLSLFTFGKPEFVAYLLLWAGMGPRRAQEGHGLFINMVFSGGTCNYGYKYREKDLYLGKF